MTDRDRVSDPQVHASRSSDDFDLWSDNPSNIDLLAFGSVADTIAAALLDDNLDPVVLGVSGRWGSGKTTVLNLVKAKLASLDNEDSRILVVSTDPWRYDPATGIKESLISEVLVALECELNSRNTDEGQAKTLLKRLVKRVDWGKALTLAAKSSLLMQIPSLNELMILVRDSDVDSGTQTRGLEEFRSEFSELMNSEDLKYIKRVVVLVDDLDRCLPPTVIETLEGIRLFLAVPKMCFVIAADEDRVADAIRTRFGDTSTTAGKSPKDMEEEPAKLYLHKIVHTTVPLPALSRFDTQAYLLLLQALPKINRPRLKALVAQCDLLRKQSKDLADLSPIEGVDLTPERAFAERLTPILYEKLRGNPRRTKRFLNDLHVRRSIATRRGIELQADTVAKMMVLEQLLPEDFEQVLRWLANATLRSEISKLEDVARRPARSDEAADDGPKSPELRVINGRDVDSAAPMDQEFSDSMVRWARLSPALGEEDLSAYLHLAASFAGETVLDRDLPERLRDIAVGLLSNVRAEQHAVTDETLRSLPFEEARSLLQHLGRMGRDRPVDQRKAVEAILRISRQNRSLSDDCCAALCTIPGDEVSPPSILLFTPRDKHLHPALRTWRSQVDLGPTQRAIDMALVKKGPN